MIPKLTTPVDIPPLSPMTNRYLSAVRTCGFSGDIHSDTATRMVMATDNSVYQVIPQVVVFPHNKDDVAILAKTSQFAEFRDVHLCARGGGTGTNGQALSDGIVVDVSRHMNRILEVNVQEKWVRVEPGVILDRLNKHLQPLGLFFGPTLSPANRATLGGMISTDASGKGSRVYGKTSDHILELESVLVNGQMWRSRRLLEPQLNEIIEQDNLVGLIHRTVRDSIHDHYTEIRDKFPKLDRFMTGYNLAMTWSQETGDFDLNRLLAGSEGTLAFIVEAKLNLLEIPTHRRLVVLKYTSFDDALASAQMLAESKPTAIETIDDTVLSLARHDAIWHKVGDLLADTGNFTTKTINLVEFAANDAALVEEQVKSIVLTAEQHQGQRGAPHGVYIAKGDNEYKALWDLRKKGVGLLGNTKGARKPVPFVEDTVVPPTRLPEFVRRFREILDDAGLTYGMFGHVDVGCLHVRPALDLKDTNDEKLLREISDKVTDLVHEFGGVLWGEHGKGYRSEYVPRFFGDTLYQQMRRIKQVFDPRNQLNPGKLATPLNSEELLVNVDGPKRGWFDRQIPPAVRGPFTVTIDCNGNAACFNEDKDDVMCPSYKVTHDRVHSPKGRASLMREWLRQIARAGYTPQKTHELADSLSRNLVRSRRKITTTLANQDFSHDVYDAMNGCLGCKACATQCPIRVDVPDFRSEFYALYHTRYARPIRDYFIAALENATAWMSRLPRLMNTVLSLGVTKWFLRRIIGIVDTPRLEPIDVGHELKKRGAPTFTLDALRRLDATDRVQTVILLQDTFTSYYEGRLVLDIYDFLRKLGYTVWVAPPFTNGKGLHVRGFLRRFRSLVDKNVAFLRPIAELGIPIIGIDPAVTLTYRDEYPKATSGSQVPIPVALIQEWLCAELTNLKVPQLRTTTQTYALFSHCTEKSLALTSQQQWVSIFAAFGLKLNVKSLGCCGMSGVYGHEAEHVQNSRAIFDAGWAVHLEQLKGVSTTALATGYSCRSQIKRFHSVQTQHPIQGLLDHLKNNRIDS